MGPDGLEVFEVVDAPLTEPLFFEADLVPAWLTTFVAAGVGVALQYHMPLASAQDVPSLAVVYTSVRLKTVPRGSISLAWPPLLLMERPVSMEKKILNEFAGINVPSGMT